MPLRETESEETDMKTYEENKDEKWEINKETETREIQEANLWSV